ncbi:hypothetical protein PAMP_024296 [Pampus punctatissimus]
MYPNYDTHPAIAQWAGHPVCLHIRCKAMTFIGVSPPLSNDATRLTLQTRLVKLVVGFLSVRLARPLSVQSGLALTARTLTVQRAPEKSCATATPRVTSSEWAVPFPPTFTYSENDEIQAVTDYVSFLTLVFVFINVNGRLPERTEDVKSYIQVSSAVIGDAMTFTVQATESELVVKKSDVSDCISRFTLRFRLARTKCPKTLLEKTLGSEMGIGLVWLSLTLSVAFSIGQDAGTGASKEDIPEGASTLAFVFDVTGSMYDDLVQVIEGASKILETSLSRPKRPLYNFALVPFHDPARFPFFYGCMNGHITEPHVLINGDVNLQTRTHGTDLIKTSRRVASSSVFCLQHQLSSQTGGGFRAVICLWNMLPIRQCIWKGLYACVWCEIGPVTITTDPKKFQYELRELYVQGGGDCPEMSIGAIKIALEISLPGSFIYVFTDARSKDYKLTHEVLQLIQQKQSQVVFVLTGDCDDRTHVGYKAYEEIASTSSGQVFHLDKKQVNEVLKWVEEAVQSSKVHLLSTDHFSGISNTWQMPFDPSLKEVTVALSGPAPSIEIKNPQGKLVGRNDGLTELLHIPNSAKVVNIKDPQPGMWSIKTSSEGRHSVRISGLSTIDFRAGFSRKPTLDFKKTISRPVQGVPTYILLNTTGLSPPARADSLELLSITGKVIKTLPIRYYPERQPNGLWNITEFIPPNEAFFLRVTGYDRDGFVFQRVSSVSYSSIIPDAPKVLMPATTHGYYLQRGAVNCQVDSLIPFTLRFTRDGKRLGVDQLFSDSDKASWEIAQVTLKDEGYYECIAISSAGTGRARTFLDVSEPPPAVTVTGNVTVSPGSTAVLTCHVVSTVSFNLTWLRGGHDARLDPQVQVLTNLSLQLSAVTPDHSGWYECIAINEGGVKAERVYLVVQEVPRVSVEPLNQTFTTADEVRIRCSASGYPPPRVVWTHNDMFIMASSRRRMTPDGTLFIRKMEKTDGGVYGCLASNLAGTDTMTSILTYIESPVVTVALSEILIGIGETTVMACSASGIPQPEIWWYKGDVQLHSSLLLDIDTSGGTLTIKGTQNVDAGDYTCVAVNNAGTSSGKISLDVGDLWVEDEGVYVCEAHNHFGKIQTQVSITVTGLVSPVIAMSPTVLSVIRDQQVTLPCVLLAGNPLPERQWLHNYGLVTSDQYVTVRRDGSLHIERVRLDDAGDYTCLAENVVGANNHTTTVNVYVIPTIQYGPQVFSTIEGTPISLPCRASGIPTPEITWSKGGELLYLGGPAFSVDYDGGLLITSPSGNETGEFICTATNAAGSASRKVQLTVYVRPRSNTNGGAGGSMEPSRMSVIEGEDAILPCEVHSVPPPTISWAKERQLISPFSPRHTQLPSGSMKILESRVSDSGLYVCVASNIAGNLTQSIQLSVLVPPSIQAGPRVMKVQVGHHVELPCVVRGVPKPTITWTKDGKQYPVTLDGSLAFNHVRLDDEGTYTCTASNTAGRDEAQVQLQVQVPPVVEVLEPPFNSPLQERVANQRIAFPCPAKGLPKPVIRWLRNGQELTGNEPGVSILEDGTLLILASVSPLDNGEYVCAAVNDAGSTERKYQLKVNVPPDFRGSETSGNVTVVLSQPTNLVCDVTGSPTPVITWYKDGTPVVASKSVQILDMGKTLKLLKTATADAGSYSCKAINIAGSTEKDFFLDVLIPPTIVGSGSSRDVSAILKQEISLECKVQGVPFPTIQWYKDRKLVFLGDPNLEVTNRGQVLRIKSARLGDQARYQCSVTNTAGKQSKDFNLSVYVPPSIKGGNLTTDVTVLLDTVVTLECEARGVPLPTIIWYRKGEVIVSNRQAQYVERGHYLKIPRAQASDAGPYTCKVTSVAGTAEKSYELDVYLPPTIAGGDDGPTERKVILSKPLILECEAGGYPPPSLTWLKDGVPVRDGESVRIIDQGRKIEILSAIVSDSGRYVCVATSIAGEKEVKYDVRVLVPPFIDGGDDVTDSTVIVNSPLELECLATGAPAPVITWYKDGNPVRQGEGLRIAANGRRLIVSRAQVSDTARFQCVATNEAGDHERDFNVVVHEPPSIRSSGEIINQTILSGFPTELECKATGSPLPAITWYQDGRPLTSAAGVTMLKRGQVLEIERAQLSDAGIYRCVAVNLAGVAEIFHRLQVFVPPVISSRGGTVTVVVNEAGKLECEATGVPLPSLTWLKDGSPVASVSHGIQVLSGGRVLSLSSAQVSDTGRYTCVAVNAGGEQHREYDLRVYVPPNIKGEEVNATVMLGRLVELHCQSDAIPPPTLSWRKDGRPLFRKPGLTVSANGSLLKVDSAQVQDSGRYTCEATNVAGKTEKNYNLNVWGVEFKSDQRLRVLSGGRQLQISNAERTDTASYTCTASSAAGTTSKEYSLQVYVRPSIRRSEGDTDDVIVIKGGDVTLQCAAEGVPRPAVTWLKDGRPITDQHGAKVLNEGRLLEIKDAKVSDTGRYTCIAVNVAGQADSKHDISVHVPPSIIGQIQFPENVSVVVKNPVALSCEASGIPLPAITWLKDGRPIKGTSSVRVLSVPPSIVGEGTVVDTKVKEKHNITLTCETSGNPVPEIKWLKDGQQLVPDRRHQVLSHGRFLQISGAQVADTGRYSCQASNSAGDRSRHFNLNVLGGRTLQILNAKEEDAGRYTCVATNEAGETLKHYEVKVYVPPQINKNDIPGEGLAPKEVKIKVNSTLTLECAAQAFPTPALQWYKDGQILRADDHVSITANGRIVQIKHAQVSDTGRYTCVATNIAGEDEKDYDVNIQVPPNFNRPGGAGDTTSPSGFGGDVRDVILNNPISLYCETNAVPPPTLTWYKDGQLLASNDKVLILPGGRVLQIPRAQAEDSGRYTCVAINEAGEDSIQYDVRVLLPPTIRGSDSDLPDEITVLANKTTQLECHVDGNPAPKITWFKDNQPISSDGPHKILSNGRTLQVLTAQVSDTGRYVCVADNVAGSAEKSFNLNVHVPPAVIGLNPENVTVVVNNFVSLSCEATGFPPPTLSWLNDKGPIQANTNALIMPGGRTLQILKAKVSDGGKYSCVAMNAAGESYKHIHLTVFVPPSIRDSSGDSPVVVNVLVGKSVALACESNAVPPPTITWYKNGRVVTESDNLRILEKGQMLEIKGSEVSDTGQYVCKATNIAVPPSIDGPAEERVVETISNPVTFACDATGIPPPSLTWLKNGRPIEHSESLEMHIFSGGSKLQIARSQLSDSGTFTCLASNVEGKARKSYHLTIQELPSEIGVLLNESIQLLCHVRGIPTPTIQWLKDGEVITSPGNKGYRISPDGSTLSVTGAHTTDSGKYTCVATNSAGEEDRIFNLNVYVPPVIKSKSETVEKLTTVLDSSVNIECVATGSPPPQLNWLRNGLPLPVSSHIRLLSAGQVLRITRTQVSDGGTYTCVASNRAGVDNRHYNLQVHVPPGLDGAGSTEDVTVVRGNLASLQCIADGTPTPTISWLRQGVILVSDPHLRFLNQNSTVQITQSQVNDTGHYTCVANNTAGQASRHFNLKVLDPPRIKGSGVPAEVSVVVNNVLELQCEASGIPTPSLTWLKDGRPLPQTDSLRLLQGGEVLRVASAQLEDTGRYSCLANSPAGDDDKEFLVRVHVPPNIAGESTPQDVSVLQSRQVTLECKSDAVPPPTLTWLKDGQPLQASARVRVLSGGRYLQINMAELSDRAQYTCVASNIAGKTTRQFNLAVNVAPTIKDGSQTVSVHINKPAVLECIVSGVPPPRVTWRKHGAILAGNNPRYTFAEDGSLHIHSSQVTDTGRYLCMATNQAGTQRKKVDLQVYVPPSIADGRTNVTVTVNVQTTLSCEATGIPKPTVSWTKNGRAISTDQNQNMYRLLSSGSLVVIAPTVEDTAVYECVASNDAGVDSRSINLTVHVPPSIADEPTELVVTRLSPVVIACTASGVPEPTIHWSKDGMKLPKQGQGYSILPAGPVEITSVELSHAGRYSCTAKNAAGSTQRHMQLTVQGGSFTVLPNGSLQISKASVSDSGTYICVAQNPAGTALGKTKLKVQVPPVISSETEKYLAPVDSSVTLQCQADGSPSPSVTWHKDGQPLSESVRQRVLSSGSLQIAFIQPSDTGRYTCIAANVAGTVSLEMSLTVQIPPSIRGTEQDVAVVENSQAQLACAAEGVPQPSLSWEKDGNPLSESTGEYTILPSGELVIDITQLDDAGSYTCVATNAVGQDSQTVTLSVYTHPVFTELLGDVALNKGERLLLACGVSGIPPPKITWAFNNNIIPVHYDHMNGHSELVIERVSKDDSGTYTCVAENNVGIIKSLGFVYVKEPPIIDGDLHSNRIEPLGGNAILNCEVRGDPLPTIQWSKSGINIQISNRIRQLDNGSLAIYGTVSEDAGNYMCVATNDAGVVERSVTLTLQSSPSIIIEPVNTVVDAGTTVVLNCQAEGEPTPVIEWSRQGRPLLGNDHFSTLSNSSLRVSSAQKEDTAEYECVARNLLGSVLSMVATQNGRSGVLAVCPVVLGLRRDSGSVIILYLPMEGATVQDQTKRHVVVRESLVQWMVTGQSGLSGRNVHVPVVTVTEPGSGPAVTLQLSMKAGHVRGRQWRSSCAVFDLVQWQVTGDLGYHGAHAVRPVVRVCSPESGCATTPLQHLMGCSVKAQTPKLKCARRDIVLHGGRQCEGNDVHIDFCNSDPCPIIGNWGPWSSWGSCSKTCNGGQMRRYRTCDNPRPANGGRACAGADTQIQRCSTANCPGGPQKARGSIIGNINDMEFGIAILNATITDSKSGGKVIKAFITNVPRTLDTLHTSCSLEFNKIHNNFIQGPAMRKLISILNPVYWTTAQEVGEAVNGYTLTGGVFRRETQVEFATGEILRMTHIARGLDSDGALLIDIVVNGHILQLSSHADISIKDYTEDYIQTGPGQLYALSTRMFSIDRESVPYSWNHTISYDLSKGKMPYLVEMLHATAISAHYHPMEEVLEYSIQASISKDENECEVGNPCSHACHNAMGTYYCSCPRGLTISADGRTCQDIDECSFGGNVCHDGQDCENTIGSYRCVMRCGRGFRRTADGLSCTDINECRQRVCRSDQQCKNTRGGYTCIDLCPNGMTKGANGTCVDIDECRDGTHQCRYNQICENTRGSYHCTCPRGYRSQGVGRPCVDINECERLPQPCAHQCVNTPGSFKCTCPPGRYLLGDGKSCAGLERLPSYESYSYGYRTSQSSPERNNPHLYHNLATQSYHSYIATTRGRIRSPGRRQTRLHSSRHGFPTCQDGFVFRGGRCLDINECEVRDACQHECVNTPGSHRCLCPGGYHLMTNGKTCQDIDECLEQNIQCGVNRMCFNMRGSYQCIDTPCPPNYQRDPATGFCLKNCPPNDLECALSPYALEYKLLSLPFGIAANQDLIRLVAYTQDGVMHPRTTFLVVDEDVTLPFALRDENLKGVLFTTQALREPRTYRMKVRALSFSEDGGIEYQTTFIVYIAVSAYPY